MKPGEPEFAANASSRAAAASPKAAPEGMRALGERFLLHRRLGEGGFGVVYEAEDLRDGGRVALKMLRHAEADWLYRFKREFRALHGLAHPSLVALDELFCENDQWFFTMELVDGINFVDYVREVPATTLLADSRERTAGPPSADSEQRSSGSASVAHQGNASTESVMWATSSDPGPLESRAERPTFHEQRLRDGLRQLFEGLAVLHAADKVHRDIKPSNVLVTREGRVVLIDFGLVTESFHATESSLFGTPAYMAPEQAVSREVGPAADLYSAGVMLYEVLTGKMPVEGAPIHVLMLKQTLEPKAPRSIDPAIPEDLDALCMKLLHIDPARRSTATEVSRSLLASGETGTIATKSSAEASTFVGRSGELGELRAAFEFSSAKGRLATVLVSGESGIGKSYLVRRFTGQLLAEHPNTMLLEGRCHEREAIPYKTLDGIVDALSRRLSRMPATDVAALLPTHRAMLARLFPVMLRVPQLAKEHARTESTAEPQNMRQRAFLALRDLFTRIAMHQPTIIVVDDLQWADEDGLRALAEILRPPEAPPLLLIGTVRVSRSGGDAALERLRATFPSDVPVLELTSLGGADAHQLAAALLRRAGASGVDPEKIATEAGGHPLFVEELARQAALGGSSAAEARLDDTIWSRVVQLEPSTREVEELVALAGRPLPQQVAAVAARLEPAEFQRRVAVLRASNLARTSGARWADAIEPYHDRVREAVLARIEPIRRRALHEALATAFEASSHLDPETLAMHWREAGNASRAASYAEAAGDQASRMLAFDRAAVWFEQALELLPEDRAAGHGLRIKLGDALAFAGRGALAAPHFEAAAAEAQVVEALELRRRAAEQLLRSGHLDRGIEASRFVLASMGMRMPATRFQTIALVVYYGFLLRLRGLRFRQRDKDQITTEERTQIDTCWTIALVLGFAEIWVGFVFLRRGLLLALTAGDLERVARAVAMDVGFSAAAGGRNWRRTERLLRHTHELAERSGSLEARVWAVAADGVAFYCNGRYRGAAEAFARLLDMLEDGSTGLVHERVTARMFHIQSLFYLGRFKELCRWQGEGLRDARARGDVYAAVCLRVGLPNVAWLVEDRPELAESERHAATMEWSTRGFHIEHFYALVADVWIKVYVGEVEQAHELAHELMRRTKHSFHWRIQNVRLRALYARGASALAMLERGMGHRELVLRQAVRDARAIERERMAWMQPFAAVLRAGIALRQGVRDQALVLLDAAARGFDAQHMTAYAGATRDRAARLRADASSEGEIARVRELLQAEGVAAPERMVAMLVPGLRA